MKNLNYSVNHNYYNLEGVKDLKAQTKMAAVLMYACIKHFTRSKAGGYDLYQKRWSEDLGIKEDTIRKALSTLIEFGHIKMIRPFQRQGNQPARYTTRGEKVYHQGQKGIPPGTTVNNYVNNYKQKDGGFNQPHPSLVSKLTPEEEQARIIEQYYNQQKQKQNK